MAAPTATSTVNLSNENATAPTQVALVMRVLRILGDWGFQDTNTNNLSSSGLSVTIPTASTYTRGQVFDWTEDGSFDAAIVDADSTGTTVTLQNPRGAFGATAAAHDGSTTPKRFRVDPAHLSHAVSETVTQTIQALYPEVFLVRDAIYSVPASPIDEWFAAPAGTLRAIKAYQFDTNASPDQVRPLTVRGVQHRDSTNFTTFFGFQMQGISSNAGSIHVLHTASVDRTTLTARQTDIVVYEAAAYLLEAGYARNPQKGEDQSRVPFESGKVAGFRRQARQLRLAEMARLRAYEPTRKPPHIAWSPRMGHVRWH